MKLTRPSLFLAGFYVSLLIFWVLTSLYYFFTSTDVDKTLLTGMKDTPYNFIFAFVYGLIPLFAGIIGIKNAKKWGYLKSSMGKALLFFSMGLLSWGIGETIWSYYNFFLSQDVPYPAWSDVGFILACPLWAAGAFYLSQATGAKYGLKKMSGRLLVIGIPLVSLFVSYYLLVIVARQGVFPIEGGLIKVFFDLAYPISDVIILSLTFLIYGLSFNYLGGRFKLPVLITLVGFICMYIADFSFSYTTTVGSFYNGSWVDLMFASALFVMGFGLLNLDIHE